ncbi:hypothetical protein ACTMTJ_42275 [Phytohabitans sp. LJ34]|uniref:hypothetical protein n=1 Tax=Phytohabitans sp. LJ34 TaxID=3452217 RepID=UPI003F8BE4DC
MTEEAPLPDRPFEPEPYDTTELQRELEEMVERLLPHGVDEATPHVLDRLVDRHTLRRVARLAKQWVLYRDAAQLELNEARAELAHQEAVYTAERRAMAGLEFAYREAERALAGTRRRVRKPATDQQEQS